MLLSEERIPPYYTNPMGQSAIHIAAQYGHLECLKCLLLSSSLLLEGRQAAAAAPIGAIEDDVVNSKNRLKGATPLHCCLYKAPASQQEKARRLACVHLLINAGASLEIVEDSTGKTALQYWKENGYDDVVDDDDENQEGNENENQNQNQNDQDFGNGSDTSSCTGPAMAVQVQPE
jgi:ankyrin repeat protein